MATGRTRSRKQKAASYPTGKESSMMTAETTGIAIFLGTMLGTAFSIVIARLLMDPRIRAIEDKVNLLLEMMLKQYPPQQ